MWRDSVKRYFINFKNEYLYSRVRIFEFCGCVLLLIIIYFLQKNATMKERSFISQFQGFTLLYITFRFGIVGMGISSAVTLKDCYYVMKRYIDIYNNELSYNYLVGFFSSLTTLCGLIVVGVISNRLKKHKKEIQLLAISDELTGILNKRNFYVTLESEINNSNESVGLILVDMDNLSKYNYLYGHSYGDLILKNTAEILKEIITEERLFRFDGDGFAILVKDVDIELLDKKAKDISQKYEDLKKNYYNDSVAKNITISIGMSLYPSISSSKQELILHANTALYQAKNMSDNKATMYQDVMMLIRDKAESDQQMVGVFKGLLTTINAKDRYTFGHCERVSSYAVMIGEAIGLEIAEMQTLLHASLLHDIGKIEVPKSILNKAGKLTDEEFKLIMQHPAHSANILEPLSSTHNLIDYVVHHHERFDGTGYPDGQKGEEICLGARILCVADCFDAMISDRPYRSSMKMDEAFEELRRCSGRQFDPVIVEAFIDRLQTKNL